VFFKVPALDYFDDKDAKPIAIEKTIGRRPIAVFGNSDGDLQMLQWSCAGPGTRLCLFVRHTDAEREWAYDISPLGRLDKGLEEAKAKELDRRRFKERALASPRNLACLRAKRDAVRRN
jgi:hypothetical protein